MEVDYIPSSLFVSSGQEIKIFILADLQFCFFSSHSFALITFGYVFFVFQVNKAIKLNVSSWL